MSDIHTPNAKRPTRWRRSVAALAATCATAALVAPSAPTAAAGSDAFIDRPSVEVLDLGCEAQVDHGSAAAVDHVVYGVACRWSVPTSEHAVGVRLRRVIVGSGQPRETVFRTDDVGNNQHVDAPVRPDRRYAYRAQALNAAGRVVATSRTVVVGVRSVGVEVLRLDCRVADGQPQPGATRVDTGCSWTSPTAARVLTLWRSVDGGAREQVASFTHPFPTSYRDVVPASADRVVYALVGTDGDGVVVARSRPDTVRIPDPGPVASDPVIVPLIEPATEPVTEPAPGPVIEPTGESDAAPVNDVEVEPEVEPVAERVTDAEVDPVTEPVVEAEVGPVTERVVESEVGPVTERIVESGVERVAEPAR